MQTQNRPVDPVWGAGEEAVRGANGGRTWSVFTAVNGGRTMGVYLRPCVKQITKGNLLCASRNSNRGSVTA